MGRRGIPLLKTAFGLTELEQYCVGGHYSDGYTFAEIAHTFECSRLTVIRAINRAKAKLRRLGLPMPRHYGGSRREWRRLVPSAS